MVGDGIISGLGGWQLPAWLAADGKVAATLLYEMSRYHFHESRWSSGIPGLSTPFSFLKLVCRSPGAGILGDLPPLVRFFSLSFFLHFSPLMPKLSTYLPPTLLYEIWRYDFREPRWSSGMTGRPPLSQDGPRLGKHRR